MPSPLMYKIIVTGANEEAVNGTYLYDELDLIYPKYFNTKNNNIWFRYWRSSAGRPPTYAIREGETGPFNTLVYYITVKSYPFVEALNNNNIIVNKSNLGSLPIPNVKGYWRNRNVINAGGNGKLTTKKRN